MKTITEIIQHFQGVVARGNGYMALCPCHKDNNPSLSLDTGNDGRILLKCFAGCPTESIIKCAGLSWSDLNPDKKVQRRIVAHYVYTDENGQPLYRKTRYEPKSFSQCRLDASGNPISSKLGDVRRVPYHLPRLIAAAKAGERLFLVEGEKDVESLERLGLTATSSGSAKEPWRTEFSAYLQGAKSITIIADKDPPEKNEAGQQHAENVRDALAKSGITASIVLVEKGKDATDWINAGARAEDFIRIADNPPAWQPTQASDSPNVQTISTGEKPFSNYWETKIQKSNGTPSIKQTPKPLNALINELKARFNDYPRRLGSALFDDNVDSTDRICQLLSTDELFAWIQRKSNAIVSWGRGNGFVPQKQLFAGLMQSATKYNGVSAAPHFPMRPDIYYIHAPLPPPEADHAAFWRLIDFFNPADAANRTLIAAAFCAPMFYDSINDRPMWLIDTDDAQGSGKTSIVNMNCHLYAEEPMDVDLSLIKGDATPLTKRLLSADGRRKRIVLFDNLDKTIKGGILAKLITAKSISGMAPYGRGEETRPNDLTYFGTVNGASVDTDMATRCYTLRIKAVSSPDPAWATSVRQYIDETRPLIFANIIDMIKNAPPRRRNKSRFGTFDATVLSAVCQTDDEFHAADLALVGESTRANEDVELCAEFKQLLDCKLKGTSKYDASKPCVITQAAIVNILRESNSTLQYWKGTTIRQHIKAGHLPDFSKGFRSLPDRGDFKDCRTAAFYYGTIAQTNQQITFQYVDIADGKLVIRFQNTITQPTI